MCRFLMVRSSQRVSPGPFLAEFAALVRESKSYDGDWQGDGWGISWVAGTENERGPVWKEFHSLRPIWEGTRRFRDFPGCRVFLAHARSATFAEHKGVVAFNQPYNGGRFAFVFNGLIRGMRLSRPVPGKIGAQKLWALIRKDLATMTPLEALAGLRKTVLHGARDVQALNIGLSDGQGIFAVCQFSRHPVYYTLHVHQSERLDIIASEPLGGHAFRPLQSGECIGFTTGWEGRHGQGVRLSGREP